MAKTVVGFFDSFRQAEKAVDELTRNGIRRDDISIIANQEARSVRTTTTTNEDDEDTAPAEGAAIGAATGAVVGGTVGLIASLASVTVPVVGPILAAGPIVAMLSGAGIGAVTGGLIGALVSIGVPEEEARLYEEGIRRGGTLVTVRAADDAMANRAADILNRHGAVDIQRRRAEWSTPAAATAAAPQQRTARPGEEVRVPVVEEELRVGKRQVETGGVRVQQKVTQQPVKEQVQLHDETVRVERRPANRPATAADLRSQPGEQTFEVRETHEEPVIQKGARIVEEVVVRKEERDRTQTIQDTVRRTDVEVQPIAAQKGEFARYDDDYRKNFNQNFSRSGLTYEQCSPAYLYGSQLAGEQRYAGRDWKAVESDARRDWESRNPGTWDKMKSAVHYGWDRVKEGAHHMTH